MGASMKTRVTVPFDTVQFPDRCVDCDGPVETELSLTRKIKKYRVTLPAPACRNCASWRKKTRLAWVGACVMICIVFAAVVLSDDASTIWASYGPWLLVGIGGFAIAVTAFLRFAEERYYNAAFNRLWIDTFTRTGPGKVINVTLATRDAKLGEEIRDLSSRGAPAP